MFLSQGHRHTGILVAGTPCELFTLLECVHSAHSLHQAPYGNRHPRPVGQEGLRHSLGPRPLEVRELPECILSDLKPEGSCDSVGKAFSRVLGLSEF